MYSVKEIFFTIQGEGCNAGKYAIFCRFSGCNLWNGREEDRKKSICNFCDTDFIGTNGINGGKFNIDWICVSPKDNKKLKQNFGDELKLVFPQQKIQPKDFENLNFKNFLLQPMDGPKIKSNTIDAREFCNHNNNWKLSLQTHKILGYP